MLMIVMSMININPPMCASNRILTTALTANGVPKVVPRETKYKNPKNTVTARDLPYTVRTRRKNRKLLEPTARILKMPMINISA